MKCRILVIDKDNGERAFLGLETCRGTVIDLNELSEYGILKTHFDIKKEHKHDVLVNDVTDF